MKAALLAFVFAGVAIAPAWAFAYVALGMDELAEHAFREAVARKPALVFEEATTSPKIRAAFERAQRASTP